jgi:FkbM family methyltransferase
MSAISYAQNFEDILLARAFPNPVGFYIDVGAADPVCHSVTKLFYDRGWRGINIEPQEEFFNRLREARSRDLNLKVAASEHSGDITLYQVPSCIGWATVSANQAHILAERGIEVVPQLMSAATLAEICAEHVSAEIDFLKIDVEGAERQVLLGADFNRWRPRVVVVEATEQGSSTPNFEGWEKLLIERDYLFAQFDGLNRYYVRSEDQQLMAQLEVPVNCFDDAVKYEISEQISRLTEERDALTVDHEALLRAYARLSRTIKAMKNFNSRTREQLAGLQSLIASR